MPDSPSPAVPAGVAEALGRLPSGLFILTTRRGNRSTGLLASWVQQAGFDPPMVTVALGRDRYVADWVAESGRFVLNQLRAGDKHLLKHFARGFGPDEPAFTGLDLIDDARGGPVLVDALGYLDLEVAGDLDGGGDHRVLLARLVGGALLPGDRRDPMVHVRRNGLHY